MRDAFNASIAFDACICEVAVSNLTVRNLDDDVKQRLRERAAANGHSMEEEARIALRAHVAIAPAGNVYDTLRKRFEPVLGMDLPRLPRGKLRPLPDLFKE
jgi:plasmid stability protein